MRFIFALVLFAALFSYGVFQYEIVTYPYNNQQNEGYGGNYFTVSITGGSGSIYITDKINNLYSMSGNGEVLARNMSDYGYVDSSGNMVSGTWETIVVNQYQHNQWNDLVVQTGYKLGDFNEGDTFGVWMANKSGTINGSVYDLYSAYGGYALSSQTDSFNTVLAELDYHGSAPIFFGFYGVESDVFSGQPLPALIPSMLAGLGALSACTFKSRRARG